MSKRKKVRKSTTPSNKLHKIASTISIVPLVAMSPFLFNNSYALASPVEDVTAFAKTTHGTTIDLYRNSGPITLNLNDYFSRLHTNSLFSMNSSSNSIISVSLSGGTIQGLKPGTATITIGIYDGEQVVQNSFTVAVIDPALVINALDTGHDGLDVGDIVRAISTHNLAADMNGDGHVDNYDYPELLSLIQPVSNHNPDFKTGITHLPTVTFDSGHNFKNINLYDYFSDLDGNSLSFKIYNNDTTEAGPTVSSLISSAMMLSLIPHKTGSSTFTIVVNDNYGGYKVADLTTVITNHPPQVTTNPLNDLVLDMSSSYDLNQLFLDPDNDPISYSLVTTENSAIVSLDGHNLHLGSGIDNSTVTGTVYASDSYTPGISAFRPIKVQLTTHHFMVGSPHLLPLSNFFNSSPPYTTFSISLPSNQTNVSISPVSSLNSGFYDLNIVGNNPGTFTFTVHSNESISHDKTFMIKINGHIE